MSDETKAPRTWIIERERFQLGESSSFEIVQVANGLTIERHEKIKVIEHSAYEALKAECDQYRLTVSEINEALLECIGKNAELREALKLAKDKLKIFRANTNGEYQGGMEFEALMTLINKAGGGE